MIFDKASSAFPYATALLAILLLILNSYVKDLNPGEDAQKHRETASDIWNVREKYLSLLTDIRDPSFWRGGMTVVEGAHLDGAVDGWGALPVIPVQCVELGGGQPLRPGGVAPADRPDVSEPGQSGPGHAKGPKTAGEINVLCEAARSRVAAEADACRAVARRTENLRQCLHVRAETAFMPEAMT